MNAKEVTKWYYEFLRSKHFKVVEYWTRDMKSAKKFLETGRSAEDFKRLIQKGLLCPPPIPAFVCSGLHRFMYKLADIELAGERPWDPSPEERQASIKAMEAITQSFLSGAILRKKEWVKDENGGWKRA